MNEKTLIQQLFKSEYRKIVSVLCKLFGAHHIETAEDIANDTFLLASETWGVKGLPENPTAWLYTVAKNKTKDYFKRRHIFSGKIVSELKYSQLNSESFEMDLSEENSKDSQLKMIFVLCNPLNPTESQIALALRILCGFGIDEIAVAFLTNKETINKRLFRAKEKMRMANIEMELPNSSEIHSRLETVLSTLYLLFNEGYHSSSQHSPLRKELCLEAMRLNYFLIENEATNQPMVNALMALMCFHASRFEARINAFGQAILYDEQDRTLWDEELIAKGNYFLIESAKGNEISKYHIEASIAYWHCTATAHNGKWEHILQLYNQLLQIEYSPITALNRTYALSKVQGNERAIEEAMKLQLNENHFYHCLLGKLHSEQNPKKAMECYEKALILATSSSDKRTIQNHLKKLR
ncbi:MAG: RNA polymerase subunit sigma [Bacteroidetes bacterium]|nr:RNA polymerase subunit sigma [Bacteroidota bacterium]